MNKEAIAQFGYPGGNPYTQIDQLRRLAGKYLDALGWGPQKTPSRVVFTEPCLTLNCYDGGTSTTGPVVLLIPAPIKRAYIWDLIPRASVVRRCLEGGFQVYLMQWEPPGAGERGFGLADYADRLILAALDAVQAETGHASAYLAGHSLGGTCAALFAALHPQRVRGLILLGAPVHFRPKIGVFGPVVAATPPIQTLTAHLGNVPGSVLSSICVLVSPATFDWARCLDWLCSLNDPEARRTHLLVERWTLDEMPLAQRLFEEFVELLYREDRFMCAHLRINGKRADPKRITTPLLSVVDRHCNIAPPEAMLPLRRAVSSPDTSILWYEGDIGVALRHVGMLVGKNAHRYLWPPIIGWLRDHASH